ncbi:hypothetical protein HYW44_05345 [Candidatus Daviesbacteria bacterium]|nr:hypothetical protein [Candidatus Daviesbacteria bacterium]
MEKAILKTLAYYDIFEFPLKAWEVHKWLIGPPSGRAGKSASLKQVEKKLKKLNQESRLSRGSPKAARIMNKGDYFFLTGKKGLVKERVRREKVSKRHYQTAKLISLLFKVIPWVKLVGVSGSLAMMGSREQDDIDIFIVTGKNRIWITRLFLIILTSLTGIRRKRREKILSAAGKVCINLILEEDNLAQRKKNIYLAHEVLQMHVLWQKEDLYSKFLHDNEWVFRYLPNWRTGVKSQNVKRKTQSYNANLKSNQIIDWFEGLAKRVQLKIMNGPSGSERIESGALYFHPEDKGKKILEEYKSRISKF